jgi:hypothetical protein
MRYAIVLSKSSELETIQRYLPANYSAFQNAGGPIIIRGEDNAGWTLEGYVIPRLASGLHTARELVHSDLEEYEGNDDPAEPPWRATQPGWEGE